MRLTTDSVRTFGVSQPRVPDVVMLSTSCSRGCHHAPMQSRLRRLAMSAPVEPVARRLYGVYRRAVPRTLTPLEQKAESYDDMTVDVARRSLSGTGTCIDAGANRGDL